MTTASIVADQSRQLARIVVLADADALSPGEPRGVSALADALDADALKASLALWGAGDVVTLTFTGDHGATFDVYRDGALAAAGATSPWRDVAATTANKRCLDMVSGSGSPYQKF